MTFTVRWNELDQAWYMSLSIGTVPILDGVRMVSGSDLLYGQGTLGGALYIRPLQTGDNSEVGLEGWGVTHELVYQEDGA